METQFWQQLGSSHGRAETLGAFEIATGDFRSLLARGAEYARVTAADVQKAAATYLATGARSVVIARPSGEPVAPQGTEKLVTGVGALVSAALMVGVTPPARAGRGTGPRSAGRARPARW